MNDLSSTFCVLPWTHLATYTDGSVLLCCVAQNDLRLNLNETTLAKAWNSPELREARRKMLNGQQVASCAHCYREEKNGIRSHRVTENQVWEQRFSREWLMSRVNATAKDGSLQEGLVSIDLRLGNTCNLTCVMCRPQDSSKWIDLSRRLQTILENQEVRSEWNYKSRINPEQFEWYKRPEFWDDVKAILPDMREMIIGGGEPMLLAEHKTLIDECVASGHASHIQLRYHTNGTRLTEEIFETWKHFKLVEVFVSLDGIGARNNYMRYPADWNAIESNLRKLDSYPYRNVKVMLLCSVHAMSVFYLEEFSRWIEAQDYKLVTKGFNGYFHPGIVHYPPYLSAQILPASAKAFVAERMRSFEAQSLKPSQKIEGVLNFMSESDQSQLLPQFKDYIRKLDIVRKTNFAEVMPELNEYLKVY